ncbi:MAG TPA: SMC-Scp complex subunit ScpB [Spirochaetia bacterium]|nr:SMC-Scp complex subunit ScpB [Spirochaetia bacterium]
MELTREAALIEAVLLLENDPVELRKLMSITGLSQEAVEEALGLLRSAFEADGHGLEIVEIGGGFSFAPRKNLWEQLRERYGKSAENRLSKAALETLAIIAYSQPITRAEIESIRGVSADGMIKLLASRNFIREVGKKDVPGKPVQYGTTREFLKAFRLATIADLPKLDGLERERFEPEQ